MSSCHERRSRRQLGSVAMNRSALRVTATEYYTVRSSIYFFRGGAMRPLAPTFEPDRWVPPPELADGYRISQFMHAAGMTDPAALLRRAAAEPEWFYPAALEFVGGEWMRPWTAVRDESDGAAFGHWFVGAGTNVSWLACERGADLVAPAIIWEGDDGDVRTLSYETLGTEVRRAAAG